MRFKKTTILGLSFAMGALVFAGGTMLNDKAVASANDGDKVNASFVMDDKAEMLLRADAEESGVRFLATMTHSDYVALMANEGADKTYKDISFGMVIFPADYEDDYADVNFTTLFSEDEAAKKYDWATWDGSEWKYAGENGANGSDVRIMNFTSDELILTSPEANPYYALHGSIKNILPDNYAREFVGRAYVTYTAQDDTVSYEWAAWAGNDAANNTCSVAYLAQTALATPEDFTPAQQTLLQAYVDGASTMDTTVSVEHYQETLDGDYELKETTTQTAKVNGIATATAQTYTGFTVDKTVVGTQDVVTNALADGKSTLKLYYTRNVHNVVFETNGGSAVESVPVKYGATYTVDAETKKAGETFGGWYFGTEYTEANKADTVVMGDADVTVNAMWLTVAWEEAKSSVALKWHSTDEQGLDNTYALAAPSVMANGVAYDWEYAVSDCLTIDGNVIKTNGSTNGVVSVMVNGTAMAQKTVTIRDISEYRIIRTLADCVIGTTEKVILANDIDFGNDAFGLCGAQMGGSFEFDGNGHALKNITIGTTLKQSYGSTATWNNNNFLFRGANFGVIHDVSFLNVTIDGSVGNGAGIVISNNNYMYNVYMEGVVIGNSGNATHGNYFGLVGRHATNATLRNVVVAMENRSKNAIGTLAGQVNDNCVFDNCYSISMTGNPIGKQTTNGTIAPTMTNVVDGVYAYTSKAQLLTDAEAMANFPAQFKNMLNETTVNLAVNLDSSAINEKSLQKASYALPVVDGVSYVSANEAIAKVEDGAIVPVSGMARGTSTFVYAMKDGAIVSEYRVVVTDYTGYTVISQSSELININGTKNFVLANDIDFGTDVPTVAWDQGVAFNGIFDGNGFEIKDFVVAACTYGSVNATNNMYLFRTGSGAMTMRDVTFTGKVNRDWQNGSGIVLAPINMIWYNVTMNLTYQGGDSTTTLGVLSYLQPNCQLYGCTFNVEKASTAGNFPVYITTLAREQCAFYNCVVNSATINGAVKEYRPYSGATNVTVETKDFFGITFNDLSAE